MKIVFLAFNIGISRGLTNGPGMCLYNFAKFMSKHMPEVDLSIYTRLKSTSFLSNVKIQNISNLKQLKRDISECSILHCWSGLDTCFADIIRYANNMKKYVILGPNLLDLVSSGSEREFLKNICYNKVLTVNDRLKYSLSMGHGIDLDLISVFQVGPDLDEWAPTIASERYVLWKGNRNHIVKDIGFALEVEKSLPQYRFLLLGRDSPYSYKKHISEAKGAALYFSSSISETMGLALAEQWAAGVPSVTHPNIYLHGENYKTGIITNRDVSSYCNAIIEIMENEALRKNLSQGARAYMEKNFSSEYIIDQYNRIIQYV